MNMDRHKTPTAYSDFIRTKDSGTGNGHNNNNNNNSSSSRSSTFHGIFPNNNNSTSTRSSTAEFMRSIDPNNNNNNINNSSSSRSSYRSNRSKKLPSVAAASMNTDNNELHAAYIRQHSAAMFAIASNSSSSASEPSHSYNYHSSNRDQRHYQASRPQDPDDDYFQRNNNDGDDNLSQRKDPPRYDSRPNLKNDLSDSYQPYEESNKATHVRSHYEDNDVNNHNLHHHHSQPQRYEASTPIRSTNDATAPIHHNNTSTQPETPSTAHSTHKPAPVSTDPRPSPRAGQPPASTTLPVSPGLPSRTLGSRGLLLGRSKNRAEHRRRTQQHHQQQHYASLAAATMPPPSPGSNPSLGSGSHDYSHSYNSNRVSPAIHDPGPLQGLSKTITVECTECGELIQHVAKNAIALECPSCQKFYPTVTCRVVQ